MPTLTTRSTVETFDIHLRGLRVLRLSLARDPAGTPETLTFQTGYADPWRPDSSRPLMLPVELIPELRRALGWISPGP